MKLFTLLFSIVSLTACAQTSKQTISTVQTKQGLILSHAEWQATQDVTYDGSYRLIDYPNGDVPANIGVCTDVVVRAYRAANIDMQVLIHEDVQRNLQYYYPIYYKRGTAKADPNIDHRRVHIIRKFLNKNYPESKIKNSSPYLPGDIIVWGNWHIGILINEKVEGTDRYYAVHNIGAGPQKEDVYYDEYDLDHYRWKPYEVATNDASTLNK
jgi:uncharacterized protein YijF (DUF1287 family)